MARRPGIPADPRSTKPNISTEAPEAANDGTVAPSVPTRPLPGDGGVVADAGEFVLGTLDAEERRRFEHLAETDREARELVNFWRTRLRPLDEVAATVSPSPAVWNEIEQALPQGGIVAANDDRLRSLRRSRNRWRGAAIAATLLFAAGAFALFDPALRGQVEQRLGLPSSAPVVASLGDESYLAVVNSGGKLPAMIVRVDGGTGRVSVRPLALPRPEAGSLELWHIPQGTSQERSVGLLDEGATIGEVAAKPGDTFAVTEEAVGGSVSGRATGPILLSGQLVREPD